MDAAARSGMVRHAGQPDERAAAALIHLRRPSPSPGKKAAVQGDHRGFSCHYSRFICRRQTAVLAPEAGIADLRYRRRPNSLTAAIDHRRHRLGLRDVGHIGQGAAAGGADLIGGFLDDGAVAAAIDDNGAPSLASAWAIAFAGLLLPEPVTIRDLARQLPDISAISSSTLLVFARPR